MSLGEACALKAGVKRDVPSASESLLSDYRHHGKEHGIALAPILFTLTPCGSAKTLQFMKWLGISISAGWKARPGSKPGRGQNGWTDGPWPSSGSSK